MPSRIEPFSYLQTEAAALIADITSSGEPVFLEQDGEKKLVLMDFLSYEKHEEALAMLKLLAKGSRDIERGRFRNADEVMDEILREDAR